ncbi:hypothetical protein NL676_020692 [Syzygium grande]|nr:hypothetical protein NL676_020692 [Syzygium grande]
MGAILGALTSRPGFPLLVATRPVFRPKAARRRRPILLGGIKRPANRRRASTADRPRPVYPPLAICDHNLGLAWPLIGE